jgi:hypothetical protein
VIPRPRFRLPLWAVPLIVLAIYAVRSLLRGSWRLELPMDAVLVVLVVVVMFAVARLRAYAASEDEEGGGTPSDDGEGPTS